MYSSISSVKVMRNQRSICVYKYRIKISVLSKHIRLIIACCSDLCDIGGYSFKTLLIDQMHFQFHISIYVIAY